ncbi:hypothetical protein, partial [Vibrio parahaemolyticus]|uniref:hypothetical protein n=1 Tax=Vibrio parahaemolyticus TaxID=670 RepID=UPI001C5E5A90
EILMTKSKIADIAQQYLTISKNIVYIGPYPSKLLSQKRNEKKYNKRSNHEKSFRLYPNLYKRHSFQR